MTPTPRTVRELADLSVALRPRVEALIRACPHRVGIVSAWRSPAEQQRLYDGWVKRLPGFNPANRPGQSKHERTVPPGGYGTPAADAADLSYSSNAARDWCHDNAASFGLHFPIPREAWHVESNGRRWTPPVIEEDIVDDAVIKKIAAAVRAEVQKDIVTVLRSKDQPSIKSLDDRLKAIETALGAGK